MPASERWGRLAPIFLGYVLSFVYVAIYWNNHHHSSPWSTRVSGAVLWANLHLLFWLSLIPFATSWLGEHPLAPVPTALYGMSLLMPATAWYTMQVVVVRAQGGESGSGAGAGRRSQRQAFAPALPRRHGAGVCGHPHRGCGLRPRRPDVAGPGSAHREGGPAMTGNAGRLHPQDHPVRRECRS